MTASDFDKQYNNANLGAILKSFTKNVEYHFDFLVSEKGYRVKWTPGSSYTNFKFSKKDTLILVALDKYIVEVSVKPLGDTADELLHRGIRPVLIPVNFIGECLDENFIYKPMPLDHPDYAKLELKALSKILKTYCSKMLTGDFSEWEETVYNCIEMRGKRQV